MKEYSEKFKTYGLADEELEMVSGGSDQSYGISISAACFGCGTCVVECQLNCIKIVGGRAVADSMNCICCEKCVPVCPVNAITLEM